MEQTGWFPAISKSEMLAYNEFELVKSAEIASKGLHIELKFPFHHTYAKFQVYRTVAILQPLNNGKTATVYDFQNEYFVVSPRQECFGELDRSEILKCHGTDRLLFCKSPFALTRSLKNSGLSGLFFDQEKFDHVEKQLTLAPAPKNDNMKSEIFKAVKFTLIHLLNENIYAKKLLKLADPFTQLQKMQRQDYSEKLMQLGIVPFNSFIILAILLVVGLGVACSHWKLLGRLRRFLANRLKNESSAVEKVIFSKSTEKEEPVV